MKRWLTYVLAAATAFALVGCDSGEEREQPAATMNPKLEEKMANPKLEHEDEYFDMRLHVVRTTYKAGEPIEISASLAYTGEEKSYTVWGSSSAQVVFTLTDGKNFDVDGASTSDLVPTEFKKGETVSYPFVKSGGFGSDDPDADFWKSFYAEKELKLPAGTYLVTASCNFALTQDVLKSGYDASVYTTITVTE
jgi:hypothetical protein